MTAHDVRIARAVQGITTSGSRPHHPLGELDTQSLARRVVIFTPGATEIEALIARARGDLGDVAGPAVVCRVLSHNPDSLWAFARRDRYDAAAPRAEGFLALLMLNRQGMWQLMDGTLDGSNPGPALLTAQHEKPAGIYLWAVHARGILAGGIPLVLEKVSTPLYHDVDMYARAITADGQRILEATGFRCGATYDGMSAPRLYMFRRSAPNREDAPPYDNYRSRRRGNEPSVTVARSLEDMMRVMAIRSAVYLAEQECPYAEEFDGNDFCAAHLIGYIGGEPAGCLRIRYFAEFAKMERLAIRREFRRTRLAFKLVRAGIELCRAKGYRKIYGHSQKRLLNFWGRFGFKPLEGGREFVFSDFDYVEVTLDMSPHPQAVAIGVDPYVTIRPEGRWHVPGILERSAIRPATRPSAQRRRA